MSIAISCPECGTRDCRIFDSRANELGVRRRRECAYGHRFTTQEMYGDPKEIERLVSKKGVLDLRMLTKEQQDAFRTLHRMAVARVA